MKTDILFVLGGVRFSGAEKRILLTAMGIAEATKLSVAILLRRPLFDTLKTRKPDNGGADKLKIRTDLPLYRGRTMGRLSYSLSRILLLLDRSKVKHFALFTVLDVYVAALCRPLGSRVYFEVTSVDIARSKACRLLLKHPFLSDGIICVSETVFSVCNDLKQSGVKTLMRTVPYVDDVWTEKDLSTKENSVFFAHRLMSRKNPILVANTFKRLGGDFPDWKFAVCGGGPLEDEVRGILADGPDNAVYLGHQPNFVTLLSKAKIFVSMISPDNYPSQSVLEALSCACSLVLSDTGQSKLMFLSPEKENGKLVSLSEESLYQGIAALIKDENLDSFMQESRRFFLDKYSKHKYISESVAFYSIDGRAL